MNTLTLSKKTLIIIDDYLYFKMGSAVCSVPYFNNKTKKNRAAFRVLIGKGSVKEIRDEVETILIKNHIIKESLADESLKKIMVENNIGIDCSGFTYYVLNGENLDRGKGVLESHIDFIHSKGLIGKIRSSLRPIENCDVATLAHDNNSKIITLGSIKPADMITMLGGPDSADRDHILIISQVDYENNAPKKIYYFHAVAYPEDGLYGSGIKQGTIDIVDVQKSITEQNWIENGLTGEANRIHSRAKKSITDIRRLNWL